MKNKVIIDFQVVDTKDPYVLMLVDTSEWFYAKEKPASVIIKLPSSNEELVYKVGKNKDLVFNSHNLGLSCLRGNCEEEEYIMLPDGIYEITLQSGYSNLKKTRIHYRKHQIMIKFYKKLIKLGGYSSLTQCQKEAFANIVYMIKMVEAFTSEGDKNKAIESYRELSNLVDKFIEDKNCN